MGDGVLLCADTEINDKSLRNPVGRRANANVAIGLCGCRREKPAGSGSDSCFCKSRPESVLTDKGYKHFSLLIYDGHLRFFDLCISQSEDINL